MRLLYLMVMILTIFTFDSGVTGEAVPATRPVKFSKQHCDLPRADPPKKSVFINNEQMCKQQIEKNEDGDLYFGNLQSCKAGCGCHLGKPPRGDRNSFSFFNRYYYNKNTNKCQEYTFYGDSEPTHANSFRNLNDCKEACVTPNRHCFLCSDSSCVQCQTQAVGNGPNNRAQQECNACGQELETATRPVKFSNEHCVYSSADHLMKYAFYKDQQMCKKLSLDKIGDADLYFGNLQSCKAGCGCHLGKPPRGDRNSFSFYNPYYYDKNTNKCQEYTFYGDSYPTHANSFSSLDDCRDACVLPNRHCFLCSDSSCVQCQTQAERNGLYYRSQQECIPCGQESELD